MAETEFVARGYATTSLAHIAAEAAVSADTIYKVFGSKIGLLKQLLDVVIGGDDEPVALLDRSGPQRLRHESDVREQLHQLASGVTRQLDRIRPIDDILRSAAAVDPEAAALRQDIQDRQRYAAMKTIATWLNQSGALGDQVDLDDAADKIWALTSPELHELLRTRRGWSSRRYAEWLESTLAAVLL